MDAARLSEPAALRPGDRVPAATPSGRSDRTRLGYGAIQLAVVLRASDRRRLPLRGVPARPRIEGMAARAVEGAVLPGVELLVS
jgi:hypothetical protein